MKQSAGGLRKVLLFTTLVVQAGAFSLTGVSAEPTIHFAPASEYAAGDGAVSVAIGDLNRDGNQDLATANLYANSISVLLGRGDGTYLPGRAYRSGGDPRSIAIGDLNRDGSPDIVSVSADAENLSVRLNRGDGTLQPGRRFSVEGGPVAVASGDVNGDGALDVVTANRTSTLSVLVNRGDGSLRGAIQLRTGLEPVSVASGDLNADGRLDLVTANVEADNVSLLLNAGNGRFQTRADYAVGHSPMGVSIGDLNGDGKPDVATANLDANTVSVLLNGGDSNLESYHDFRAGGDPRSVAIGDADGDDKSDLVTVNAEASTVSVLSNTGNGPFQPPHAYATGSYAVSVAIGDLNRDGHLDVATANLAADSVYVLLATTSVLCTAPDVIGSTLSSATQAIENAHCRVGALTHAYSNTMEKGRISSERPRVGTTLPVGSGIDLVISDGPDPRRPRGLLLWNRLGGARQVKHSAYGPNLERYDCHDRTAPAFYEHCSIDVRGKLRYVRGVRGRAATIGRGPYSAGARVHAAVLRKSILNPEYGTVEAWYRQRSDPVPFRHNPHRIFGGPYSLTGADEVMLFSQDRLDSGDPRLHFEVFFGQEPPPFVLGHVVAVRSLTDHRRGYRISRLNGRWIHIAGVWDRRGIAGTNDTVRLYVNGKVVATSKAASWGTTPCGRRVSARPGGACFVDVAGCNDRCAGTFAVDELKLWNYAKTNFR
jgi:FG-GAP-like repeat/Concanavalin A-like lectin/glucanases superfamily/PASTA domain